MAAIFEIIIISLSIYLTTSPSGLSNARPLSEGFSSSSSSFSSNNSGIFPALMAFGDSTLDTGNNNFINTILRSNHRPYGLSFPNQVPTGRFSDGKLITDLVASAYGIKDTVPPFLDPSLTTQDLVTGVCFASAGAGLDNMTNVEAGVIPVTKQLDMFESYIAKLSASVGEAEAEKIVGGALYLISAGTNDLAVSYYDLALRKIKFHNVSGYHDFLIDRMLDFVKGLYDRGARIMVVSGLPPIGCLPIQITARFKFLGDRSCIDHQNTDTQAYNLKLQNSLKSLNLTGAIILYGNVYDPLLDMINFPAKYGFGETKVGCCGTGLAEASFLCNEMAPLCDDVSKYLFFDSMHPSEAAYKSLAEYLEKNTTTLLLA